MKILRTITLDRENAVHAPWGWSRRDAKGVEKGKAVEALIFREDFKSPEVFDSIIGGDGHIRIWAITLSIVSKWGFEVNNRWIFAEDESTQNKFRKAWIALRDQSGFDHKTTLSQANSQQWSSGVLISFLKSDSLPQP